MRCRSASLIAVVPWLMAVVLPSSSAAAATCPAPAGDPITRSSDLTGDIVVIGGGYGHGVGMSQYGARGAALLGCTRSQILAAYYPGTNEGRSIPDAYDGVRVSLMPSGPAGGLPAAIDVQAVSDKVKWRLNGATKLQRAGATWRASVDSAGRYTIRRGTKMIFSTAPGPLKIMLHGKIVRLPAKDHRYNRGHLRLTWSGKGANTFVTNHIGSLDRYLYGLREMPSSWPRAALRAQATTGRTYALLRREGRDRGSPKWATCRCDVYDSVADQAYAAYDWEPVAPAWVAAVDSTSGRTRRYDGKTALTQYHSSSGGYVESAGFVFGESSPYSKAFDDSRWERASGNENTTWAQVFSAERVGKAFGVGTVTDIRTPPPKGPSGRIGDPARGAGGVVIEGTNGTKKVSGPMFRFTLGLKSALFHVRMAK